MARQACLRRAHQVRVAAGRLVKRGILDQRLLLIQAIEGILRLAG